MLALDTFQGIARAGAACRSRGADLNHETAHSELKLAGESGFELTASACSDLNGPQGGRATACAGSSLLRAGGQGRKGQSFSSRQRHDRGHAWQLRAGPTPERG